MEIRYKRGKEIEKLRQGGRILALALKTVEENIRPGISTKEIENIAERVLREHNARPSFKNYVPRGSSEPFPAAICTSINEEVVHGIPSPDRVLKEGDIIGVDMGVEFQQYYTDAAVTLIVGRVTSKIRQLVETTRKALLAGILACQVGNTLVDIARAVENTVTRAGCSVVRDLVGHGVGVAVHEDPPVANFVDGALDLPLEEGMVIAIEPMVNMGTWKVKTNSDAWTVVTADGQPSAHFEHTVAITSAGPVILTRT